jgi:hypothetical protein
MTMKPRRIDRLPGSSILKDLAGASIAFARGAWDPLVVLAFRIRERWRKGGETVGAAKIQPGRELGIAAARRSLLRPLSKEAVGHHAQEPVDTLL